MLWSILAKRDLYGPKPVSWPELKEQWQLSSDQLIPLTPLVITAAILGALLLLIRSRWPQRMWQKLGGAGQAVVQLLAPSGLKPSEKWTLACMARRLNISDPSTLLMSSHTFDHHARAYTQSVKPQRNRKLQLRIERIRRAVFNGTPSRRPLVTYRVKVKRLDSLTRRLASQGAKHAQDVAQMTTHYKNLQAETQEEGLKLCLSLEQDVKNSYRKAILSWTRPSDHGNDAGRQKLEMTSNDVPMISNLIEALGYRPYRHVETRRHRWTWRGCAVSLDLVPYLGPFVEINGPSEQAVQKVLHQLGLGASRCLVQSDQSLLDAFLAQRGIEDRYIPLTPSARHS